MEGKKCLHLCFQRNAFTKNFTFIRAVHIANPQFIYGTNVVFYIFLPHSTYSPLALDVVILILILVSSPQLRIQRIFLAPGYLKYYFVSLAFYFIFVSQFTFLPLSLPLSLSTEWERRECEDEGHRPPVRHVRPYQRKDHRWRADELPSEGRLRHKRNSGELGASV